MAHYTIRRIALLLWAWRLRDVGHAQHGFALTKAMAKRAAERAAAAATRQEPPPDRRS